MMDYGPDWPPPLPRPRRRLNVPMLRPWPLAIRGGILAALIILLVVATMRGGYLQARHMRMPAHPPQHGVAGPGHHAHQHDQ